MSPASTPPAETLRIVWWNIRAGGGRRIEAIFQQLQRWRPDVVGLCEFRATPPSRWLADALAGSGFRHQRTTADPALPARNALLLASRWPLRRIWSLPGPSEPARWLLVRVAAPLPIHLGAMHVPNRVTGRKSDFLRSVRVLAGEWRRGPALLVGDTNSGRIGLDEENPAFDALEDGWMRAMDEDGWPDAFRHLHGDRRAYTWYSPNGNNGFRLDQAFVNRDLLPRLLAVRYEWGATPAPNPRRDALSDHAALIVDLLL